MVSNGIMSRGFVREELHSTAMPVSGSCEYNNRHNILHNTTVMLSTTLSTSCWRYQKSFAFRT